MGWLKNAVIDIAITVAIAMAVLDMAPWIRWIVYIYPPLTILLKLLALSSTGLKGLMQHRRAENEPPNWFYHIIYVLSTGILAFYQWWIWAAGWAVIWVLSVVIDRRMVAAKATG